jgi:hypothetical protein
MLILVHIFSNEHAKLMKEGKSSTQIVNAAACVIANKVITLLSYIISSSTQRVRKCLDFRDHVFSSKVKNINVNIG